MDLNMTLIMSCSTNNIILWNRYGYGVHLEPLEEPKWLLKIDEKSEYTRIGGNLPDDIKFVDPEGGPFLSVGKIIEGKIITKIEPSIKGMYKDFILTLEDKKDEEVLY